MPQPALGPEPPTVERTPGSGESIVGEPGIEPRRRADHRAAAKPDPEQPGALCVKGVSETKLLPRAPLGEHSGAPKVEGLCLDQHLAPRGSEEIAGALRDRELSPDDQLVDRPRRRTREAGDGSDRFTGLTIGEEQLVL